MTYTILAADDSKTIRRALQIVFEKEDVKLILMNNGQDAILQTRNLKPDLVIADHNMPTNGYEVAKAISSDPSCSNIPVLLLVGSSAPYDRAKYDSCGAKGEIRKPFQSASLLKTVYQAIQLSASSSINNGAVAPQLKRSETLQGFAATPKPIENAIVEAVPTPVLGSVTPTSIMSSASTSNNLFEAEKARPSVVPAVEVPKTIPSQVAAIQVSPESRVLTQQVQEKVQEKVSEQLSVVGAIEKSSDQEQIQKVTREMIEKIVWEIVPELAETMIKEEIQRLMKS